MDVRDMRAGRHHATRGRRCTPQHSTACAVGSASPLPDASINIDATASFMRSQLIEAHRRKRGGRRPATPDKTLLQIVTLELNRCAVEEDAARSCPLSGVPG